MRTIRYILLILPAIFSSCDEEVTKVPEGTPIRQYADFVINQSSEYNTTGSWSAEQSLGKEDVYPNHGDYVNAWASYTADDGAEYLILGFDSVQTVRTIEIYETYNPGSIDTVSLRNAATGAWVKVYTRPAQTLPEEARKLNIYFNETKFNVDAIRIDLNSLEVQGWNEIDAVAIGGFRKD